MVNISWAPITVSGGPDRERRYCATTAQRHFARGLAYAALGQVEEARVEQRAFRASLAVPTLQTRRVHNNMALKILEIAEEMLAGEILYRAGEHDAAFDKLAAGVSAAATICHSWVMTPWG